MVNHLNGLLAVLRKWAVRTPPNSFRSHVFSWSFPIAFVVGLLVSDWLGRQPVFQAATVRMDRQLIASVMNSRKEDARFVQLVTIDRVERKRFTPRWLVDTVTRLLAEDPKVLVIDIATSDEEFQDLPNQLQSSAIPVVWARELKDNPDQPGTYLAQKIFGNIAADLQLPQGHSSGLAASRIESDNSIFRFDRSFEVAHVGPRRTLAEQAICQLQKKCEDPVPSGTNDYNLFHHNYDFMHQSISQFVGQPVNAQKSFTGQIVVLGMSEDPADVHQTPIGEVAGMKLVATAIEHQMRGQPGRQIEGAAKLLIELSLTLVIVLINTRLRPKAALMVGLVLLGAMIYYGAWLALRLVGYQASVAPFLLGIILEQLSATADRAR